MLSVLARVSGAGGQRQPTSVQPDKSSAAQPQLQLQYPLCLRPTPPLRRLLKQKLPPSIAQLFSQIRRMFITERDYGDGTIYQRVAIWYLVRSCCLRILCFCAAMEFPVRRNRHRQCPRQRNRNPTQLFARGSLAPCRLVIKVSSLATSPCLQLPTPREDPPLYRPLS